MIKTELQVPSNYSTRSRDFQLISVLYDLVFNSSKTYSDLIRNIPLNSKWDKNFLDLLVKTLGFESKRNYDVNDLYTLCGAFKTILRDKGSKKAIEYCVKVLMKAQNIDAQIFIDVDNSYVVDPITGEGSGCHITIGVPSILDDLNLLEDLLDYVLPVGFTFNIVTYTYGGEIKGEAGIAGVIVAETPEHTPYKNKDLGHIYKANESITKVEYSTENSVSYGEKENTTEPTENNGGN